MAVEEFAVRYGCVNRDRDSRREHSTFGSIVAWNDPAGDVRACIRRKEIPGKHGRYHKQIGATSREPDSISLLVVDGGTLERERCNLKYLLERSPGMWHNVDFYCTLAFANFLNYVLLFASKQTKSI